jgi:predicted DCC family thiol-disulfide oxidoreductase YuxK
MGDHDLFPLEVWIDGSCKVCRRSERWCRKLDKNERIVFRDLHYELDPPAPKERLLEAVHVRRADGVVESGFEAWRQIMLALDRWRWLGRISALPIVRQVGRLVYAAIALNRHRLPGDRG